MAFFKKKKEEKEDKNMTTLEQVRKAYEDLSEDDKKSFHQSLSDRVHESIAAQERADGNEDSQTAADREHEALGAEHADERREEEKAETHGDDKLSQLLDAMSGLMSRLDKMMERPELGRMEEARQRYGVSAKPVSDEHDRVSPEEALRRLRER